MSDSSATAPRKVRWIVIVSLAPLSRPLFDVARVGGGRGGVGTAVGGARAGVALEAGSAVVVARALIGAASARAVVFAAAVGEIVGAALGLARARLPEVE